MHQYLSDRAVQIHQGGIRAFFDMTARYPNAIKMSIGEPDIDTPARIVMSAEVALRNGKTHYTANAGILPLRQAIAAYLREYELCVDPDTEVIVSCGAMGALFGALTCLVNPGDEVLIQDPQWLNYASQIQLLGGVCVRVPVRAENGFVLEAEAVERRITPRTKILMLNSPNNPTGAVLDGSALRALAEVALRHDLLVISDEVYCELLYDGAKHISIASLPGMAARTLVVNSCSKTFAMTGWRVGFAAGPRELIQKMTVLQENTVACAPAFAQEAACYAYTARCDIENMRALYRRRRDLLLEGLAGVDGLRTPVPRGAFYVFADCRAFGRPSWEIATALLEEAGVATVPGACFGDAGEGFLRLAYSNSEANIGEAVARMKEYFAGL